MVEKQSSPAGPLKAREVMLLIYLVQFLIIASVFSVNPILVLYVQTFGTAVGLASVIAMSPHIISATTQIPFGILSDRIGRGRLLYISALAALVGPLMCYFACNLEIFFVARIITGFTMAAFMPIAWALTMDLAPKGRSGEAIGRIGAAMMVGMSLGPVIGGFVASAYGARTVFLVSFLIAIPVLLFTHLAARRISALGSTARQALQSGDSSHTMKRNFIAGLLVPFVVATALGTFTVLFPDYAQQILGMNVGIVGIIISFYAVSQVIIRAFAGSISDRYGRRIVILCGFVLSSLGIYGLSFLSDTYSLIAMGSVFGVGAALVIPAGAALVNDSIASNRRGVGMGSFHTFLSLGSFLGVSAMGFVAEKSSFGCMFVVTAAIQFVAALGLFIAIKSRKTLLCS